MMKPGIGTYDRFKQMFDREKLEETNHWGKELIQEPKQHSPQEIQQASEQEKK
jgi:NADH dehydrogenase